MTCLAELRIFIITSCFLGLSAAEALNFSAATQSEFWPYGTTKSLRLQDWFDVDGDGKKEYLFNVTFAEGVAPFDNSFTCLFEFNLSTGQFEYQQTLTGLIMNGTNNGLVGAENVKWIGSTGQYVYSLNGETLQSWELPENANGFLEDIDHDGDLDLVSNGIYRNDSGVWREFPNTFGSTFINAIFGSGDFDNDGDTDLIRRDSNIFWNDGYGRFTKGDRLIQSDLAPTEFIDWDDDGDRDIILRSFPFSVAVNEGGGNMPLQEIAINPSPSSIYDRADLEGDGDFDLFLGGDRYLIHDNVGVYHYEDTAGVGYPNFPVDIDDDGDLDILAINAFEQTIYYNQAYSGRQSLSPPTENLAAALTGDGLILSWNPPANKPPRATYSVIIGTDPTGGQIVSPRADWASGARYRDHEGNAGYSPNYRLSYLEPGSYYWRVQTVDTQGNGSAWSEPQSFIIPDQSEAPEIFVDENLEVNIQFDGEQIIQIPIHLTNANFDMPVIVTTSADWLTPADEHPVLDADSGTTLLSFHVDTELLPLNAWSVEITVEEFRDRVGATSQNFTISNTISTAQYDIRSLGIQWPNDRNLLTIYDYNEDGLDDLLIIAPSTDNPHDNTLFAYQSTGDDFFLEATIALPNGSTYTSAYYQWSPGEPYRYGIRDGSLIHLIKYDANNGVQLSNQDYSLNWMADLDRDGRREYVWNRNEAQADVDDDGDIDRLGYNQLFLNAQAGSFQSRLVIDAQGNQYRVNRDSLLIFDRDHDGRDDILFFNYSYFQLNFDSNGEVTAIPVDIGTTRSAYYLTPCDIDHDSDTDLLNRYDNTVLFNDGHGNFAPGEFPVGANGFDHMKRGDFNGDGKPDLLFDFDEPVFYYSRGEPVAPPPPPVNLTNAFNQFGTQLSWDAPENRTDLRYDYKLKSLSGQNIIYEPAWSLEFDIFDWSGRGEVAGEEVVLYRLPPGDYEWSVRSVDPLSNTSPWASASLTVPDVIQASEITILPDDFGIQWKLSGPSQSFTITSDHPAINFDPQAGQLDDDTSISIWIDTDLVDPGFANANLTITLQDGSYAVFPVYVNYEAEPVQESTDNWLIFNLPLQGATEAISAVLGDYDNDGDLDILTGAMLDGSFINLLRREEGFLEFTPTADFGLYGGRAAWNDIDGDGDLDFILTGLDANNNPGTILGWNDGHGQFSTQPFVEVIERDTPLQWDDFDADGDSDLIAGKDLFVENGMAAYEQTSQGVFQKDEDAIQWSLVNRRIDVDGNGADNLVEMIAVSLFGKTIEMFHRIKIGIKWHEVEPPIYNFDAIDVANLDNDSLPEQIWLACITSPTLIFNDTRGIYYGDAPEAPWIIQELSCGGKVRFFDLNNDGMSDLIESPFLGGFCGLNIYQLGDIGEINKIFEHSKPAQDFDVGDIDGDGLLDIIYAAENGLQVIINRMENQNAQAPTPPTNLSSQVNESSAILSWTPPVNANQLEYNLRIGRVDMPNSAYNSQSDPVTGKRLLRQHGNSLSYLQQEIALPDGVYIWSVQSVSPNRTGSAWAPEQLLIIGERPYGAFIEEHFNTIKHTEAQVTGPFADPDQDGRNNLQEMIEGTDPNNRDPAPHWMINNDALRLQLNPANGAQYRLYTSTDLVDWTLYQSGPLESEMMIPVGDDPLFLKMEYDIEP